MSTERELLAEARDLLAGSEYPDENDVMAWLARYAALPPALGVPGDVDPCATCGRPTSYVVCPGDGSMIPCCSDACFPGREKPATPEAPAMTVDPSLKEHVLEMYSLGDGEVTAHVDGERVMGSGPPMDEAPATVSHAARPEEYLAAETARAEKAEAELVQAFADQRRLSVTAQEAIAFTVDKLSKCRAELEAAKALLDRALRYTVEDKAVTPGLTRLARLMPELRGFLRRPGPVTTPASRTPEELAAVLIHAYANQSGRIQRAFLYLEKASVGQAQPEWITDAHAILADIFRDVTGDKEGG